MLPSTPYPGQRKEGVGSVSPSSDPPLSTVQGRGWKEGPNPEQKLVLVSVQNIDTTARNVADRRRGEGRVGRRVGEAG